MIRNLQNETIYPINHQEKLITKERKKYFSRRDFSRTSTLWFQCRPSSNPPCTRTRTMFGFLLLVLIHPQVWAARRLLGRIGFRTRPHLENFLNIWTGSGQSSGLRHWLLQQQAVRLQCPVPLPGTGNETSSETKLKQLEARGWPLTSVCLET